MPGISIDMADFNPRAHEGHDAVAIRLDRGDAFQSTCPRGARLQDVACLCELWISIHVPTRGTTKRAGQDTLARYFNPRAHEGHDYARRYSIRVSGFQSTCPRGARLPVFLYYQVLPGFQSTCPRGARRAFCYLAIQITPFQSTCPRGARRYCGCKSSKLFISIHVPTRGTTTLTLRSNTDNAISIHVPTRGTTITGFRPLIMFHFNPRAHEGHDVSSALVTATNAFQSTCPRGARPPLFATVTRFKPFQSTCPRGARRDTPYNYLILQFQSTCPRGARRQR